MHLDDEITIKEKPKQTLVPKGAFGKSQRIKQLQAFIQRKLYPEATKCYMIQELWPSDYNEFQLGHQLN